MTYRVKEIFKTLQGEGYHVGRAAVFLRFSGCNLWSGHEEDRERGPGSCSRWCDTDFVGGDSLDLKQVVQRCVQAWGTVSEGPRRVVITGGEPLLQLDAALVDALGSVGFLVHLETNGTRPLPPVQFDWVTCSPKHGGALALEAADELRLAYPQWLEPAVLFRFRAKRRYLSPIDDAHYSENARSAVAYCLEHPEWAVSVQVHKMLGIR